MKSPFDQEPASSRQKEVLRRFSYAEEFKARPRPNLRLYIAIELLMCIGIGAFMVNGGIPLPWWLAVLMIGLAVLGGWLAWSRSAPVCPHCKKNIQLCRAICCHVCGEPLKRGRCDSCSVLQSWTHVFTSLSATTGNKEPIRFCPGCGVLLDTDFHRWLGGGRGH